MIAAGMSRPARLEHATPSNQDPWPDQVNSNESTLISGKLDPIPHGQRRREGSLGGSAIAPCCFQEGICEATWKKKFRLPWREAGSPNHRDDEVDRDQ